ncbi:hypothetical protein LY76DRAFT_372959 [Colletotrichum caudatum]|nr:hypothetical protein LY76DRAFT_372959 [Colletotrichum caudatum]
MTITEGACRLPTSHVQTLLLYLSRAVKNVASKRHGVERPHNRSNREPYFFRQRGLLPTPSSTPKPKCEKANSNLGERKQAPAYGPFVFKAARSLKWPRRANRMYGIAPSGPHGEMDDDGCHESQGSMLHASEQRFMILDMPAASLLDQYAFNTASTSPFQARPLALYRYPPISEVVSAVNVGTNVQYGRITGLFKDRGRDVNPC